MLKSVSRTAHMRRENPSTISSLVLLLGLFSRFPTNELRVATNAQKTPPSRLRFSYNVKECLRNLVRITHNFSNRGIRGQSFEQNSRLTYELQELTTDCANQLRSSRTEYDSAANPNSCQFVGFWACVE